MFTELAAEVEAGAVRRRPVPDEDSAAAEVANGGDDAQAAGGFHGGDIADGGDVPADGEFAAGVGVPEADRLIVGSAEEPAAIEEDEPADRRAGLVSFEDAARATAAGVVEADDCVRPGDGEEAAIGRDGEEDAAFFGRSFQRCGGGSFDEVDRQSASAGEGDERLAVAQDGDIGSSGREGDVLLRLMALPPQPAPFPVHRFSSRGALADRFEDAACVVVFVLFDACPREADLGDVLFRPGEPRGVIGRLAFAVGEFLRLPGFLL